jgi:acyl-CoA synthetase (AMP-forming)/AMP-acid ligase II
MHPRIHARNQPDALSLIMAGSGETVTYADLEARANRGAHALRALGLQIGDTVAMASDNRPEFFDLFWATQRSGLTLVPMSTRLKADEIAYILEDSGAKALLISQSMAETAQELMKDRAAMPGLQSILAIGAIDGLPSWGELCAGQPAVPIADEADGARMAYSSGTTGRPKGVRNATPVPGTDPIVMQGGAKLFGHLYPFGADTVYLSPAPLYHAAPMGFTTATQSFGGTVVVMEKFDPETYLSLIERYKVTLTQVVPTMFVRLLKLPEELRRKYDCSSLKAMVHAAAPCPVPVKQAMIDWLGPVIEEYYSGTEGSGFVTVSSEEWLKRPGTVGRAMIGKIHICDDEGDELPVGETGTVYFSDGPEFAYHNDAKKTASSRNPMHPSWSTLGDVGRVDEEGYLFLSDRKHFMIISGGVNIYPQEIENLLVTHPKVADVAVFGVPNAEFGEEVKAVVQPVRWEDAGDMLAMELIGWCKERLANVKCPRSIDFELALPRAETGKLYKTELKARYWPAG